MINWLSNAANASTIAYAIFTLLAFIAAACAARYAKRNIDVLKENVDVLREQTRRNTFSNYLQALANSDAREDRGIIHKIYEKTTEKDIPPKRVTDFFIAKGNGPYLWKEDDLKQGELNSIFREVQREIGFSDSEAAKNFKDAIEETISLFDRLGYSLLQGDHLLIDEAPVWVWDMTKGMWAYFGDYLEKRQELNGGKEKNHAKYFKDLAYVAMERDSE